ncbi:MAG: 7-cyano-7-deazaguanine synthase, partial [Planctomycetes bacterium]|nr:7-cyano-7-deazaguanine synthase [Planctomycetota bacterium]
MIHPQEECVGLLLSGGLDSSILLTHLLAQRQRVQPLYIRLQLVWEDAELRVLRKFLQAVASPLLQELVILQLPVDDLYDGHWSITGRETPGAETADDAVYLPGRNPLLLIKAALWCQMRGIRRLALAPLGSNPFADATDAFFNEFQSALSRAASAEIRIERPFANLDKRQVMALGKDCPLELTFSCIAPVDGLHCGVCNKCA